MKRLFSMYATTIRVSFASASAYRANFFFNVFMTLINNLGVPFVTLLIYGAGASIPGWNIYQALLVQASFMLCSGIAAPFIYGMVWYTMERVKEGSYDLLLIKPCPVIMTTMAFSFELDSVGMLLGGGYIFAIAIANVGTIAPAQWLYFAYFMLCGIIMLFGIICLMTATAFKWVGNGRIFEIFSAITGFGKYPLTIFPRWLTTAISWIFPISVMGYFPASALLNSADPINLLLILPCIAFAIIGCLVFLFMINSYQSAGG